MHQIPELCFALLGGLALGLGILITAEQLGADCWVIEQVTGNRCVYDGDVRVIIDNTSYLEE